MRMTSVQRDAPDMMGVAGDRLARVRAAATEFQAECLAGEAARAALANIAAAMEGATPFQTPFWLTHWFDGFAGASCEPLLVLVRALPDSRPVMALPLVRRLENGKRCIEFFDADVTDYNAPLLRHDFSASRQDAEAIWEAVQLVLPPADILQFDKMPYLIGAQVNPLTQIAAAHESQLHGNLVTVGDSFDAYVRGFHRKYRKEVGREKRVFESFDGARFVAVRTLAEAEPVMAALERIQAARMNDLQRTYDLDNSDKKNFYRDLLRSGLADGSITLTALMVKDDVIAALYCVNQGGHCAMVRIAQAGGEWSVCSPGRLIILETMRWLHGQGFRIFDFTIGAYDYKRRLGAAHVPLARVMIALSLGGQIAVTRDALKRKLRRISMLRTLVRRLRGTRSAAGEES